MAIEQVVVVSIPVSDGDRAKAFYVDTLGLELVGEDDSVPGLHWIQVKPRGGEVSLSLVTWFGSMPAGSLQGLVLTTDDLRGDYEALSEKGVRFDHPPEPQPYAALETVLRDPDGNGLVLQQR